MRERAVDLPCFHALDLVRVSGVERLAQVRQVGLCVGQQAVEYSPVAQLCEPHHRACEKFLCQSAIRFCRE